MSLVTLVVLKKDIKLFDASADDLTSTCERISRGSYTDIGVILTIFLG